MLLNDFFETGNTTFENDTLKVPVNINKDHSVFEGHFPGNPVVPGVCMVQMLNNIINEECNGSLVLHQAKVIKFTQTIVPGKVAQLYFEINMTRNGNFTQVKAELNSSSGNHFKFSGTFISDEAV